MTKVEREQLTKELASLNKMMTGLLLGLMALIATLVLAPVVWGLIPYAVVAVLTATIAYRHKAIEKIVNPE
jgi:hypothetical protein